MQKMIEVAALENGAHKNQTFHGVLPDGWAVIPDDMELPASFPFVEVEAEGIIHYKEVQVLREVIRTREAPAVDAVGLPILNDDGDPVMTTEEYTVEEWVTEQEPYTVLTVVSMAEGIMPEPAPEPEEPVSLADRVQTLEESSAEMTEALELLLSGVTE